MAIALVVAILAGASPALCAVRPTADPIPGATALLTPLPLVGGIALRRAEDRVLTVPINPASEPAGPGTDGAAGWDEGDASPLLFLSGTGAFLVLLMILLASRRKPQPRRTS